MSSSKKVLSLAGLNNTELNDQAYLAINDPRSLSAFKKEFARRGVSVILNPFARYRVEYDFTLSRNENDKIRKKSAKRDPSKQMPAEEVKKWRALLKDTPDATLSNMNYNARMGVGGPYPKTVAMLTSEELKRRGLDRFGNRRDPSRYSVKDTPRADRLHHHAGGVIGWFPARESHLASAEGWRQSAEAPTTDKKLKREFARRAKLHERRAGSKSLAKKSLNTLRAALWKAWPREYKGTGEGHRFIRVVNKDGHYETLPLVALDEKTMLHLLHPARRDPKRAGGKDNQKEIDKIAWLSANGSFSDALAHGDWDTMSIEPSTDDWSYFEKMMDHEPSSKERQWFRSAFKKEMGSHVSSRRSRERGEY